MNRFEHYTSSIDLLFEYENMQPCEKCVRSYSKECKTVYCSEEQRAWLLEEYVESDSWDKLLEDISKVANTYAIKDIATRISRLIDGGKHSVY